jgi:hypothetical protein
LVVVILRILKFVDVLSMLVQLLGLKFMCIVLVLFMVRFSWLQASLTCSTMLFIRLLPGIFLVVGNMIFVSSAESSPCKLFLIISGLLR